LIDVYRHVGIISAVIMRRKR